MKPRGVGISVKKACTVVLSVLGLLGAVRTVYALTVAPGRTEARLSPGHHLDAIIRATNDTQDKLRVSLSTKDWFVLEANKIKNLTVKDWLRVNGPKEFELKPGASREVKITITCPKQAEGELVGMVSFLYETAQDSMMTPMISVSVYLEVAGTEKLGGEIDQLVVQEWNNQIQAAVSVKSTGNVHLRPKGTITVLSAKGEEISQVPTKEGGPAYPGRKQVYVVQFPTDFKPQAGRYVVSADLGYRELSLKASGGFEVFKDGRIQMDLRPK